jgi:hypothetical protein
VLHNTLVGKYTVSADDFAKFSVAKDGRMKVTGSLWSGSYEYGKIEINCFVELGEEWDWFVFNYQTRMEETFVKNKTIKKYSKTMRNPKGSKLSFPLRIEVSFVSVFDLKSVHPFSANRPYVVLTCGSVVEHSDPSNTKTKDVLDSSTSWDGLTWTVFFVSENANLIFVTYSAATVIGRFSINAERLLRYSRTKENIVEVVGDLLDDDEFTGKIVFKCKVFLDNQDDSENESDSSGPDRLILPASLSLQSVQLSNMPKLNMLRSNSPSVSITCGDFSKSSLPMLHAGASATWNKFENWIFPVKSKMIISVSVTSEGKLIGLLDINIMELQDCGKDNAGNIAFEGELLDAKSLRGNIKLVFTVSEGGDNYLTGKRFYELAVAAKKAPVLSGYSQMTLGGVPTIKNDAFDKSMNKVLMLKPVSSDSPSKLAKSSEALKEEAIQQVFPFRMIISEILVTDLKSVHILGKNSPQVKLVCGGRADSTLEVPGGGASANWTGLSTTFYVHERDTFNTAVWSKGSCIGGKIIDPLELIECSSDDKGRREYFSIVSNDAGKIVGKIKLSYILEYFSSYNIIPDPDTIIPLQKLQFPIMVTFYTISVINLKSVHPFSKNSPQVKAISGNWRAATNVSQFPGNDAKWEQLGWSLLFKGDSKIKLSVVSGSVVIGYVKVSAQEIIESVPDSAGLCEIETYIDAASEIATSKGRSDTGMIRITFSVEGNPDISDSEHSSEDEPVRIESDVLPVPDDANEASYLQTATAKTDKLVTILSVSLQDLKAVHSVAANSPYVKIHCGNFKAATKVT